MPGALQGLFLPVRACGRAAAGPSAMPVLAPQAVASYPTCSRGSCGSCPLTAPFTAPFNATTQPAIGLPLHRSTDRSPVGVPLLARLGEDASLLAVAARLEALCGGFMPWPAIRRQPAIRPGAIAAVRHPQTIDDPDAAVHPRPMRRRPVGSNNPFNASRWMESERVEHQFSAFAAVSAGGRYRHRLDAGDRNRRLRRRWRCRPRSGDRRG
ncbi:MAG: hypothetical protein AB7O55_23675 [Lautropia sp.]